jgi:hypothetical protein
MWPRTVVCCVLLVAPSGCGPMEGEESRLVVDPELVRLPGVREGDTGSASVRLLNLGRRPLQVSQLRIFPEGGGWTVAAPPLPALIPPGEELGVAVAHRPGPGVASTSTLRINTDDPDDPAHCVGLQAVQGFVLVAAAPTLVDFGLAASGATVVRPIRVQNFGLAVADALRLEWLERSADINASLPATEIAPGGSLDLLVSYTPRGGDAVDRAFLRLAWSTGALTIPLSGRQDLLAPD